MNTITRQSTPSDEHHHGERALLEQRRRELAEHYYECRRGHPINPDVELIEQ